MTRKKISRVLQKYSLFFLFLSVIFAGATGILVSRSTFNQDTRTRAAGPVCDQRCVVELDCCKAIKANDDPYECAWPDRGWCFPSTCAPYDGQKTNCGWYWKFHNANDNEYHLGTNSPEGYGCMIGGSEGSMVPICEYVKKPTPKPTVKHQPTTTPKPTKKPKPTIAQTATPTKSKKQEPTDTPVEPTDFPNLSPTVTVRNPTRSPVVIEPGVTVTYNQHTLIATPGDSQKNSGIVDALQAIGTFTLPKIQLPVNSDGQNVLQSFWKNVGDFTKMIAP